MLVTRLITSFTLSEIAMPVLAKVSSILKKKSLYFVAFPDKNDPFYYENGYFYSCSERQF